MVSWGFPGRVLLIFGGPCVQEDATNLSTGIQWTGRAMPLEGLGLDFNLSGVRLSSTIRGMDYRGGVVLVFFPTLVFKSSKGKHAHLVHFPRSLQTQKKP